jgi:putative tricarboxylic transport membrane protein
MIRRGRRSSIFPRRGAAIMKRVNQIAAIPFIGLGLFILWESRGMKYYSSLGPGAGFLPFWVGAALTLLSLIWLVLVSCKPTAGKTGDFLPNRQGGLRILIILSALILCVGLLNLLGFSLTMLAFLAFLLLALGRRNLIVTAIISVAGSFGVGYVFEHWLGVFLPKSSLWFLKGLGL